MIAGCIAFSTKPNVARTIVVHPVTNAEKNITKSFNLTGRISIQDDQQRVSGGIRWQHSKIIDEVLLLSPLGQVMAQIIRDQKGVQLTTSEQQVFYAADVESLTEEILGWRIPLAGLQFWAQGSHSPATLATKDMDKNDRVVAIRQDGWEINYLNYTTAQPTQESRPRVLTLSYEALRIRLVVDSWKTQ